ncbi:DmsC/YnfH family molybdoenzyme membrane anchor subunit, partial [Glaesserella parasuis]|uniref:DmsC/YnfH family molybdoenzyme membrane anchor subunit n=2 Tax=Glaesserella parasuis TaxID=738 RepID=UPI003B66B80E
MEHKLPTAWQPLGRVVVAISGLIFIGAMAKLYLIPTVPTWNSVYTPVLFFLTVILAGSALAVGLLQAVRCSEYLQKTLVGIAIVGAIATAISTYLNYQYLLDTIRHNKFYFINVSKLNAVCFCKTACAIVTNLRIKAVIITI